MTDLEQIVKGLEDSLINQSCGYMDGIGELYAVSGENLQNAIDLLKEQKPLPVFEGKVNECTCGHEINRYWHPKFCGFCGKELIWY